jgi:hypothetical protein
MRRVRWTMAAFTDQHSGTCRRLKYVINPLVQQGRAFVVRSGAYRFRYSFALIIYGHRISKC